MTVALGILRALLAALGGWAVSQGYLEDGDLEPMIGAALILATAIWSAVSKHRAGKK